MKLPCTIFLLLFWQLSAPGQLLNGSFEENGNPVLTPWIDQCNYANLSPEVPVGGGDWCLELQAGNTQSCFPAYVYQLLPEVASGTFLQVEAMARNEKGLLSTLYLGKVDAGGQPQPIYSDTTSSMEWTLLTTAGLIELEAGETAAVLLQGGLTGGPVGGPDFVGYFDLVSLSEDPVSITETYPESVIRFPNPVEDHLPVWTRNGQPLLMGVQLFSAHGRELLELRYREPQQQFDLYLGNLPAGPYFLLIDTTNGYRTYWVLRL